MRLDLLVHRPPDASLELAPELCALVDPDQAGAGCERDPLSPKQPVAEDEDAGREERAKLDVELLGFSVAQ